MCSLHSYYDLSKVILRVERSLRTYRVHIRPDAAPRTMEQTYPCSCRAKRVQCEPHLSNGAAMLFDADVVNRDRCQLYPRPPTPYCVRVLWPISEATMC